MTYLTWATDGAGDLPPATVETRVIGHSAPEGPARLYTCHAILRETQSARYWEGFGDSLEQAVADAYRSRRDDTTRS